MGYWKPSHDGQEHEQGIEKQEEHIHSGLDGEEELSSLPLLHDEGADDWMLQEVCEGIESATVLSL